MSAVGLKPIVEVQFADYIYPGINQLVTEVSKILLPQQRENILFLASLEFRLELMEVAVLITVEA